MITTTYIKDKKGFVELAKSQDWLATDMDEAYRLGGKNIPTTFNMMQSNFLEMCVVKNDGVVIAMIALQFDNQLVYFNTNAVKSCLKSYLQFLRVFVSDYIKERSYLTVVALNDYVTTNKKLKLIGFKRKHIYRSKTEWVAGVFYGR